jgi:hypothetical protein
MKAAVIRYLNDIVSLTVLTLMAMALVAGQVEAAAHAVDSHSVERFQVVLEIRTQ